MMILCSEALLKMDTIDFDIKVEILFKKRKAVVLIKQK
jgi:hypothetical protein